MSNVILFNPADNALVTFDWSDILPAGITLSSATPVVHTVPSPLGKTAEATNNPKSQVKISGAIHGAIYQIKASATLSNGENINRVFPIRAINS